MGTQFGVRTTNALGAAAALIVASGLGTSIPARASSVGMTSSVMAGVACFVPRSMRPGHQAMKGTLWPPSYTEPFRPRNFGLPLGLGDVELSVRDDLFAFGDGSRFGLLMVDGEPAGNYFGMCHGKTSLMIVLSGFYFDNGELWGELLAPTLEALSSVND